MTLVRRELLQVRCAHGQSGNLVMPAAKQDSHQQPFTRFRSCDERIDLRWVWADLYPQNSGSWRARPLSEGRCAALIFPEDRFLQAGRSLVILV